MSTYGNSVKAKPVKQGSRQGVLLAVAVVLLLAAIGIVVLRQSNDRAEEAKKIAAAAPEAQAKLIESNPNMPPQAKAMALQQMRAHMQETQSRGAGMPRR